MSDKTAIEWTATVHEDGTITPGATWNPMRGCTRVSAGCQHCYAEVVAARFGGPGLAYEGLATRVNGHPRWTNTVRLVPEKLAEPLHWTKPRRVFVNSMSDLFHEQVPDSYIARVCAIMAITAREHTYQILTKRPERMRAFMVGDDTAQLVEDAMAEWSHGTLDDWPLPNVWLGVSAEDQAAADGRIPLLLDTPAAIRFVSAEPLLGPIDLDDWWLCPRFAADDPRFYAPSGRGLDWIIAGAESGHGARAMNEDWVRSLRDQCGHFGSTAFFYKQRVEGGHKVCLPVLDGRVWAEFPEARAHGWRDREPAMGGLPTGDR